MGTGTTLMNLILKIKIEAESIIKGQSMSGLGHFLRKCIFNVISVGPIPSHIAFIMDGNRRFEKQQKLPQGEGHKAGYSSLMVMLNHCYELGVKYVTIYAFSIENFKRKPDEVQLIMNLMLEKIEELLQNQSILHQHGIRLHFVGNSMLLSDKVRAAAQKAMKLTESNEKVVLLVCFAYTSTDEILHSVDESCREKLAEVGKRFDFDAENEGEIEIEVEKTNGFVDRGEEQEIRLSDLEKNMYMAIAPDPDFEKLAEVGEKIDFDAENEGEIEIEVEKTNGFVDRGEEQEIRLSDLEKNMYMAVAPDPDIVIRSSGEMRLSDFLTWQTSYSILYSPAALWPDLSLWHLVWGVLSYQRNFAYLEKRKKQS